jgi:hypothetical protein
VALSIRSLDGNDEVKRHFLCVVPGVGVSAANVNEHTHNISVTEVGRYPSGHMQRAIAVFVLRVDVSASN